MKAIVTGAKGYIGRRLVSALEADGHEVAAIDIGDCVSDLRGAWDVMFNLAWAGKGGALRADYNVQMGNVKVALDNYGAARALGCGRFVCTGTIGEKMLRLEECAKIKSQNFIYALSKQYLHSVLNSIGDVDGCKVVWATLGNLYGGRDSGGNIIDYTLRTILAGQEAAFGPAEQPYDFIHVDDAVEALKLLGTCSGVRGDEFYVGNGQPRKLGEYLREVGRIAERENLIGIGRRPDDGTRYRAEWFSIDPLRRETGFCPKISFEDGVRRNMLELDRVCKKCVAERS